MIKVQGMMRSVIDELPPGAWTAADRAFDAFEGVSTSEGDELLDALKAASPHIRLAEVEALRDRFLSLRDGVSGEVERKVYDTILAKLGRRRIDLLNQT